MDPSTTPTPNESIQYRVVYNLTRADIFRIHFYMLLRSKWILGMWAVLMSLLIWNDLHGEALADTSAAYKVFYALVIFIIYATALLLVLAVIVLSKVLFSRMTGVVCEHEIELREDGIHERTAVDESLHRWSAFHKLVVRPTYVYLMVSDTKGHAIPRRAFKSQLVMDVFCQVVRERAAAARGSS